jgi:kynurenine formamidase
MTHAKAPSQSQVDTYFKELNNWGRWGHDDQLGTVNLITPAKQATAERLVRTGRTVSLARPIGPHPVRSYYISYPLHRERSDAVTDRFGLVYHGYAVTHIDALCHVAFDKELYNGRPFQQNFTDTGALWCPIDPLFGGISTRGVLLDVAASRQAGYVTVGNPVTPQELDAVAARAGVRVEPGDVLVLRSGQASFVNAHPDWVPRVALHPGLHISCLTWFREHDIAAIAWDMMDERPSGYEGYGFGTHLAIPFLGLTLIDNTDPERLAVVCAEEQRYEFLFTAAPLPLVGSTGAPTHPLAIF